MSKVIAGTALKQAVQSQTFIKGGSESCGALHP